jgi:PhoH-like ATPase
MQLATNFTAKLTDMAKKQKIFVLDTSVLLHDHSAITNFEKNDVAIPITVLEELDKFKVGNDTKNFSAREVIRFIDKLSGHQSLQNWTSLGAGKGALKVVFHSKPNDLDAETIKSSMRVCSYKVSILKKRCF